MQTSLNVFDEHSIQCEKILDLLLKNDFVSTQSLIKLGIYQYNARIYELRHIQLHNIVSIRYNGVFGFKIIK